LLSYRHLNSGELKSTMEYKNRSQKGVRWLAPSVALMRRFRMPVKLAALLTIILVPLLVIGYVQFSTLILDYKIAANESRGAQAVSLITDVVSEVQHHRLATLLSAKPEYEAAHQQTNKRLGAAIDAMSPFIAANADLDLAKGWNEVLPELKSFVHEQLGHWHPRNCTKRGDHGTGQREAEHCAGRGGAGCG